MEKRKTIYTIAEELDLSPGTISKIINNKGNISPHTKTRVLNYIEKVGYVPLASARKLKSKRSYTIGVVFSESLNIGLEHLFFSSILQHFKNYIEDQGYELSFIVKKLGNNTLSYYEWCVNKKVDGVYIVVGDYDDEGIHQLVNSNIPCVSTDMIINKLHTVLSDNEQGIDLVLNFVKNELRLNEIALISGPMHAKAFKERKEAFERKTSEYNLEKTAIIIAQSFGFTSGYNSVLELLEKEKLPEIILVSSDEIATGVLKGLKDKSFNVPEDIQVIGFDDLAYSKHFNPPLTTVRQNTKLLGEIAAQDLINMIENNVGSFNGIVRVPVELVERESTKRK